MSRVVKVARAAFVAGGLCFVGYVCFVATTWTPTGGLVSSPSWSGSFSGALGETGWPRPFLTIAAVDVGGGVSAMTVEEFQVAGLLINILVFVLLAWVVWRFGRRFADRPSGRLRFGLKSILVVILVVACGAGYWRYVTLEFARKGKVIDALEEQRVEVACGEHTPLLLKRLLPDEARDRFLRAEELYFGEVDDETEVLRIAPDLRRLKRVRYISIESQAHPDAILKLTRELRGQLTLSLDESAISDESLRRLEGQDNIAEVVFPYGRGE